MDTNPKAEAVHRLLATANLFRMRGNLAEAVRACQQAIETDVENAAAHDMMGDLLVAQGELEAAMEHYRHAFQREPLAATEEKIARLALRIEDDKRLKALGMSGLADEAPRRRLNPSIACALSILFPGLGQFYNGENRKGYILFGLGLLSLVAFWALGVPHLLDILGPLFGPTRSSGRGFGIPAIAWSVLLAMGVLWAYGMLDAALSAVAINQGGRRTEDRTGWEV